MLSVVPFGDFGWGLITRIPMLKHGALLMASRQLTP
jgi:hypothetical protein